MTDALSKERIAGLRAKTTLRIGGQRPAEVMCERVDLEAVLDRLERLERVAEAVALLREQRAMRYANETLAAVDLAIETLDALR